MQTNYYWLHVHYGIYSKKEVWLNILVDNFSIMFGQNHCFQYNLCILCKITLHLPLTLMLLVNQNSESNRLNNFVMQVPPIPSHQPFD